MKIRILGIRGDRIEYETPFGRGNGRWMTPHPGASGHYEAAFTIRDALVWGDTIDRAEVPGPAIRLEGEQVEIVGLLVARYSDGGGDLALGDVTLIVDGVPAEVPEGSWLRVRPRVLDVYDRAGR